MRKRGFTLIEIIVCITLIAVIGVSSVFGVKYLNNKIKISKLEQITDKAIEAAQIYLETNKEASNELYSNSNGVSVPLQLLVNEGLLNIDNTDLTVDDLKDEYVVTFLGGSGGTENCEQITSSASWANDKPIYLCMKSDGSSNLAIIDPDKTNNLSKVQLHKYYYKGPGPDNYAKFGNYNLRILSVDTDDTITVINYFTYGSTETYKTIFNQNMVFQFSNDTSKSVSQIKKKCDNENFRAQNKLCYLGYGYAINFQYYYNTTECTSGYETVSGGTGYIGNDIYSTSGYGYSYGIDNSWLSECASYIHLKKCMKITSGTGSSDNPYIIEDKGC